MNPKYKRILVKLSGEAIGGTDGRGIDRSKLERVVEQLVKLSEENIEIAVVIGAGNLWRGLYGKSNSRLYGNACYNIKCFSVTGND